MTFEKAFHFLKLPIVAVPSELFQFSVWLQFSHKYSRSCFLFSRLAYHSNVTVAKDNYFIKQKVIYFNLCFIEGNVLNYARGNEYSKR